MDSIIFYEPHLAHAPVASNKPLTSDDTSTVQGSSVAQRSAYGKILARYEAVECIDMSEDTDTTRASDTFNRDDLPSLSELLSCTSQKGILRRLNSSAEYKPEWVSDQLANPSDSRPGSSQDKPILLDHDEASCDQTGAPESVRAADTGCISSGTPPTPSNCNNYGRSDIHSDEIFDVFAKDDNGGNCESNRPAVRQKSPPIRHNPPRSQSMLRQDENGRGRDSAADFGMETESDSNNILIIRSTLLTLKDSAAQASLTDTDDDLPDAENSTLHDSPCMKRKRLSDGSRTFKRSKVSPFPNCSRPKFRGTGTAVTLKTGRRCSSSSSTDTEEMVSEASPAAEDDSGPSGAWPFQGFLGCQAIGSEEFLTIRISKEYLHDLLHSQVSRSDERGATRIAKGASGVTSTSQRQRFTPEEDKRLIELRKQGLPWKEIHQQHFKGRSIGSLQVHYCTKLQKGQHR
ncbi:MAG: hypothetical protein M1816_002755 [Peltula sp. TS41687]|nr:MAG: hypothetical protein M1816_002755 [Peltula sp. TS41687]